MLLPECSTLPTCGAISVAAAIGGNTRACGALLSLCAKLNADAEGNNEELAPDDHEILAALAEREHGRRQGSPGSDNT